MEEIESWMIKRSICFEDWEPVVVVDEVWAENKCLGPLNLSVLLVVLVQETCSPPVSVMNKSKLMLEKF